MLNRHLNTVSTPEIGTFVLRVNNRSTGGLVSKDPYSRPLMIINVVHLVALYRHKSAMWRRVGGGGTRNTLQRINKECSSVIQETAPLPTWHYLHTAFRFHHQDI